MQAQGSATSAKHEITLVGSIPRMTDLLVPDEER
jgi:hypothetical protein